MWTQGICTQPTSFLLPSFFFLFCWCVLVLVHGVGGLPLSRRLNAQQYLSHGSEKKSFDAFFCTKVSVTSLHKLYQPSYSAESRHLDGDKKDWRIFFLLRSPFFFVLLFSSPFFFSFSFLLYCVLSLTLLQTFSFFIFCGLISAQLKAIHLPWNCSAFTA